MNLNDPNLFYNEFFQKFFEKRKEFNKGIINKDENPFDEDDEEILKKFDDIYYINHKNKSHLQIFNAIKEKLQHYLFYFHIHIKQIYFIVFF